MFEIKSGEKYFNIKLTLLIKKFNDKIERKKKEKLKGKKKKLRRKGKKKKEVKLHKLFQDFYMY
jgi:hypothetical protein